MTRFSVLGVAIGVFALVLVLSVMGGFEENLRTRMFAGVSHVEILSSENSLVGFSLNKEIELDRLKKINSLVRFTPFIRSDAVFLKKDDEFSQVTLLGLDPSLGGDIWSFAGSLVEAESFSFGSLLSVKKKNDYSVPGLIVGEGLARSLGVEVGDVVSLLNPQVDSDIVARGGQASFLFRVSAIFYKSSPKFNSNFVLTSLVAARKFMPDYDSDLDKDNFVTGLALSLSQPKLVDSVKKEIKSFSQLKVETWKDVNKSLLFALKLEKYTMSAILLLIILVAAFSISGTLMMTVFHKRNQMAIFRSLGFSKKSVLQLHLLHGMIIGIVGTFIGLSFGVGACFIISKGLLQPFLSSRWLFVLPVKFLFFDYLLVAFCSVLLSLLAAVYPAKVAASRYPLEGLRSL